jgi:hypothetical protein
MTRQDITNRLSNGAVPGTEHIEEFPSSLRNLANPNIPNIVAGIPEDISNYLKEGQQYLHDSSLVNQITTTNKTRTTFYLINDYISNGSDAGKPKSVSRLEPGKSTPSSADTDVILPHDKHTRFVLPDGSITNPGSAIRTSGWGQVNITNVPGQSNTFLIQFKGGITPGSVSEIANPITDNGSPFSHTSGLDQLKPKFR